MGCGQNSVFFFLVPKFSEFVCACLTALEERLFSFLNPNFGNAETERFTFELDSIGPITADSPFVTLMKDQITLYLDIYFCQAKEFMACSSIITFYVCSTQWVIKRPGFCKIF